VDELVAIDRTAPEQHEAARVGSPEDVAGPLRRTPHRAPLDI
jgi:hypothetical protein